MKRMKCMIVFLLVAGLAVSAPKSNAMSKKVKKQYTKVLQKYVGKGNDEYSIPKFALVDIDRNGMVWMSAFCAMLMHPNAIRQTYIVLVKQQQYIRL